LLSYFTYTPTAQGEENVSKTSQLIHRVATPPLGEVTKFSINFWPSFRLASQASLTRPINSPAPRSIGDLPELKHARRAAIDTAAVASYPPSAAQLCLSGRTCFCAVACVFTTGYPMYKRRLHAPVIHLKVSQAV